MILERVVVGIYQVNCYILAVGEGAAAIVIDPGSDEKKIRKCLDKHRLIPELIINTHGHFDHIGCDDAFGVPVLCHGDDVLLLRNPDLNLSCFLDGTTRVQAAIRTVSDQEVISAAGIELKVIHTPGHSAGGMCLLLLKPQGGILFSGDTLFYRSVGRTDFPGSDTDALLSAIRERIFVLPDATIVYPGHGPSTTIGQEKKSNPYAGTD
ncbi:MAG TPA: MBL fold metallo-hydrolase [Candidatus Omnitrophota bacterium]|nr:MBL fold metallo-hydrolase [Candidatus Omnitrophota bacterium]HPT06896.1 MBL fold metallo-hydrolase [Candidatus Omnitrophota bacterium]